MINQNKTPIGAAPEAAASCGTAQMIRRPYTSPQITAHGTVKELTLAVAGPNDDGLGGSIAA
ncbi:MAG TPA: hypothetical protein VK689_11230 [Armatimonadota bacterium]|nr:hypothetical protein [Armatimonadota bacterium]